MKADFYETLGVDKTADEKELKAAFRKLAMQFHPDRNPGDHACEHKFKEINEAYECLKDPQKRAAYDRFGHAAFENGGGMNGAAHGFAAGGFADIFEDIFGEMMGGGRRRSSGGRERGADRPARSPVRSVATGNSRVQTSWDFRKARPPGPFHATCHYA